MRTFSESDKWDLRVGAFFIVLCLLAFYVKVRISTPVPKTIAADSLILRVITPEGARVYEIKNRKTPLYPTIIIVSEDGQSVSISNR